MLSNDGTFANPAVRPRSIEMVILRQVPDDCAGWIWQPAPISTQPLMYACG